MSTITILGVFERGAGAAGAVAAIRGARLGEVETYSPTADHAVIRTRPRHPSPVRLFTLVGGLMGGAVGIVFPVYTVLDWPLLVGGKPLISIPPLVVISFELSMLGAALSGLIGFLVVSGLPQRRRHWLRERRFTDDEFGVVVTCTDEHAATVRAHLEHAGAREVSDGA